MSARLETNFVKTKYINPPIASLPLIFSNCFSFLNKFLFAVKQNLRVIENKKVLVTSKSKKFFEIYRHIISNTIQI